MEPRVFTSERPSAAHDLQHIHSVFQAHYANPELFLVRDSMLTLSPSGALGAAWAEFALSGGTRAPLDGDPLFAAIKAKQAKQQRQQQQQQQQQVPPLPQQPPEQSPQQPPSQHTGSTSAVSQEEEEHRLRQRVAELPPVPEMLKWFGECALADCGCSRPTFPRVRPSFREAVLARTVAAQRAAGPSPPPPPPQPSTDRASLVTEGGSSSSALASPGLCYVSVGSGMLLFDLELLTALRVAGVTIASIALIDSATSYSDTPRSQSALRAIASLFAPARVVCYCAVGAYAAARLQDREPAASLFVQTDVPDMPLEYTKALAACALQPGGLAFRLQPTESVTESVTASVPASVATSMAASVTASVAASVPPPPPPATIDVWERLADGVGTSGVDFPPRDPGASQGLGTRRETRCMRGERWGVA